MDQILQVLLPILVVECDACVRPSELPLSSPGLGSRPEVHVQFHRYYAPRQGNVTHPHLLP